MLLKVGLCAKRVLLSLVVSGVSKHVSFGARHIRNTVFRVRKAIDGAQNLKRRVQNVDGRGLKPA